MVKKAKVEVISSGAPDVSICQLQTVLQSGLTAEGVLL